MEREAEAKRQAELAEARRKAEEEAREAERLRKEAEEKAGDEPPADE